MRHRLQFAALAVQAVLADIRKGAGVHHGVLTELHLHHVEAEGLGLPDQILQRAVSGTLGTGGGQRTLDHLRSARKSSQEWYMRSASRSMV